MAASGKKQYGLIISKRAKEAPKLKRPAAFGDSSSDEEKDTMKSKYGGEVWRENKRNAQKLETHESVVKALAQDPSVYEYDSLYDKMVEDKKKADPRLQKKDTKSKYISRLKSVADRRKLEQELIYERKVQRELEKEGSIDDQEIYLTTAYRKKLEERRQLEKELLEEDAVEKANDVTKQKDLTRFQKHLFNQITQPSEVTAERSKTQIKQNPEPKQEENPEPQQEKEPQKIDKSPSPSAADSGPVSSPGPPKTVSDSQSPIQSEPETLVPKISTEERRKAASAKRTDSEAQLSARDRYLARKKMKLSKQTVTQNH